MSVVRLSVARAAHARSDRECRMSRRPASPPERFAPALARLARHAMPFARCLSCRTRPAARLARRAEHRAPHPGLFARRARRPARRFERFARCAGRSASRVTYAVRHTRRFARPCEPFARRSKRSARNQRPCARRVTPGPSTPRLRSAPFACAGRTFVSASRRRTLIASRVIRDSRRAGAIPSMAPPKRHPSPLALAR